MQLKIQRSQRAGGITGGTVYFCLDVRADYTPEETENIRKYKLGSEVIYNSQAARKHLDSAGGHLDRTQVGGVGERAAGLARGAFSLAMAKMSLNISIASLGKGHHIECKDLAELLEAEETVRNACKSVTQFLETAATFNGSEVVIEYDKGEERVHITQGAPPLLSYDGPDSSANRVGQIIDRAHPSDPGEALGRSVGKFWSNPTNRKIVTAGLALVLVIFLLHSCFR
ncbi:MAG TPA: hypothetical protein VNW15_01310 [Rhizomicrobium sp.]|nr:hypothetical protein [Rhizomicrobium sp.]